MKDVSLILAAEFGVQQNGGAFPLENIFEAQPVPKPNPGCVIALLYWRWLFAMCRVIGQGDVLSAGLVRFQAAGEVEPHSGAGHRHDVLDEAIYAGEDNLSAVGEQVRRAPEISQDFLSEVGRR